MSITPTRSKEQATLFLDQAVGDIGTQDTTALSRRVDLFATAPQRALSRSYQINYFALRYKVTTSQAMMLASGRRTDPDTSGY